MTDILIKELNKAAELVKKSNHIMIFSGAGLSTESGIPDFRSKNGLYSRKFMGYEPEEILSSTFFRNNYNIFWDYIRAEFNYKGIVPGKSYKLVKDLQNRNKIEVIVTQNIDSLHQDAGIENIIEVHGDLKTCYCNVCHKSYDFYDMINGHDPYCDQESCNGVIRPDIVLYEEAVDNLADVFKSIHKCDLLLVLGSSLTVNPIAQLPNIFVGESKPVIIINKDTTPYNNYYLTTELNMDISTALTYFIEYLDK